MARAALLLAGTQGENIFHQTFALNIFGSRHYSCLKWKFREIPAKNGLKRRKNGPEQLKYHQLVPIWAIRLPRGTNSLFGMPLAWFHGTPEKCRKINAKIVARWKIFWNSNFSYDFFSIVNLHLGITCQV